MREDPLKPGTTVLTNLCTNPRLGSLPVRMTVPSNFIGEQNSDYPLFK